MLKRLRDRVQGRQEGFTLIELLVVILIIGILAAVAIPTFLSQKGKATGSNVEAAVSSAQTAMETYATSNAGAYPTSANAASALQSIEPTLTSQFSKYSMTVTSGETVGSDTKAYTIVAKDPSSNPTTYFDLTYSPLTGNAIRTCQTGATASTATSGSSSLQNTGDCSATATWGGN